MKKFIVGLLPILFCATLAAQDNPLFKYIPTGARMICSLNPVKLAAKVPGDSFRASAMYREIMKKDDADLKRFFADPSISGIDFGKDIWITSNEANSKAPTNLNIFGVLKDEAQFARMIEKIKEDKTVNRYGTNRIVISDDGGSLAWNDEIFVMSAGRNRNREVSYDFPDDTSTAASFKHMEEVREQTFRAARDNCFELLTPKATHVLLTNSAFSELMSASGDIRMWTDGSPNKMLEGLHPMAGMISRFSKLSGDNKTTVIHFENGKIRAETNSYLPAGTGDLYRKYPPAPLPVSLTHRLPEGKLLGLSLTSINTDLVMDLLRRSGFDMHADSIKSKLPFDLNLLTAALRNQVMIAVLKSNNPSTAESKLKGIDLIIAVPVADKAKFEELKAAVKKVMDAENESGKTDKMMMGMKPVLRYNDQLAVLSLSEKTAQEFLAGTGTAAEPAWLQTYKHYPMVTHIDLAEIIKMIFSNARKDFGEDKEQEINKILGVFDALTFTGGNFENNRINGMVELRFTGQDNAFLQLFKLLNTAIEQSEKKKAERQKQWDSEEEDSETDVDVLPPPPPPPPVKPKKKGSEE